MSSRAKASVAAAVAAALLLLVASVVVVHIRSQAEPSAVNAPAQTLEANGAKVMVQADITGGSVVAKAPDSGPVKVFGVTPLAPPIKLEVEGGSLKQAIISFPVDVGKLPAGVPPAAVLSVLTRSQATDNEWVSVGPGDYDPAVRTLSIETTHFSEWTYAVTDFAAIKQQVALSNQKGLGFRLFNTIYGKVPPVDCPDNEIALAYTVNAPPNTLDVCNTYSPAAKQYHVELSNRSGIPLTLEVPGQLSTGPDVFAGTGILGEAWATAYAETTHKYLLRPESKLVFTGVQVPHGATIQARFSTATFLADMGSFIADMLTMELGGETFAEPAGKHMRELAEWKKEVLQSKDYLDCVTKEGNELETALQEHQAPNPTEQVRKVLANCYGTVTGKLVEKARNKAGVKTVLGRVAGWFGDRAQAILSIPDIMQGAREEMSGLIAWSFQSTGMIHSAGGDVVLMPTPPVQQLHQALPVPMAGDDTRNFFGIQRHFLLPHECGEYAYEWLVSPPGEPYSIGTGSGVYTLQGGGKFYPSLTMVKPENRQRFQQYVQNIPPSCTGQIFLGLPPITYTGQSGLAAGDVAKLFIRQDDPAKPANGYTVVAMSGDYLLEVEFEANHALVPNDRAQFDAELHRLFEHLDLFLPTTFQR